jgi:hypothetical protein
MGKHSLTALMAWSTEVTKKTPQALRDLSLREKVIDVSRRLNKSAFAEQLCCRPATGLLLRGATGYAKVCTITGPAIAVAGPASRGVRFCSIHASARLFDSAAPA